MRPTKSLATFLLLLLAPVSALAQFGDVLAWTPDAAYRRAEDESEVRTTSILEANVFGAMLPAYTELLSHLPEGARIDALDVSDDGDAVFFSLDIAARLPQNIRQPGALTFVHPGDIMRYHRSAQAIDRLFDITLLAPNGVPNTDAFCLDRAGVGTLAAPFLVSFESAIRLQLSTDLFPRMYESGTIIRFEFGQPHSLVYDPETTANATGVAQISGEWLVTFETDVFLPRTGGSQPVRLSRQQVARVGTNDPVVHTSQTAELPTAVGHGAIALLPRFLGTDPLPPIASEGWTIF